MAFVIDSRTAECNGNIRTECVKNINGLFETKTTKEKENKKINFDKNWRRRLFTF